MADYGCYPEGLAGAITGIAKASRGLPRRQLDALGWDASDYKQELNIAALKSLRAFHAKYGFCSPAETRYASASVWNATRRFGQRNGRAKARAPIHTVCPPEGSYEMEAAYEARETLARIKELVTDREWSDLINVAMEGGCVQAAWDPSECSEVWFRKRIQRLRAMLRDQIE